MACQQDLHSVKEKKAHFSRIWTHFWFILLKIKRPESLLSSIMKIKNELEKNCIEAIYLGVISISNSLVITIWSNRTIHMKRTPMNNCQFPNTRKSRIGPNTSWPNWPVEDSLILHKKRLKTCESSSALLRALVVLSTLNIVSLGLIPCPAEGCKKLRKMYRITSKIIQAFCPKRESKKWVLSVNYPCSQRTAVAGSASTTMDTYATISYRLLDTTIHEC